MTSTGLLPCPGYGSTQLSDLGGAVEVDPDRGGDDLDGASGASSVASAGDAVSGDVVPRQLLARRVQGGLVGFDGEHVVAASVDDQLGGVGLGMHGVHGHVSAGEVEGGQQGADGGDLVGLRCDSELSQDGAGVVVERRDQVRGRGGAGSGSADGLAVHGDDPALSHHVGACLQPGPEDRVQDGGVETVDSAADRRLRRHGASGTFQRGKEIGIGVGGPLRYRGERSCASSDSSDAHRQDPGQPMSGPAGMPRIGYGLQQGEQRGARRDTQKVRGRRGST